MYQYSLLDHLGERRHWLNAVLAQAKLDGVKTGLSLNILNGGAQDELTALQLHRDGPGRDRHLSFRTAR